jgi:hypothetical protein
LEAFEQAGCAGDVEGSFTTFPFGALADGLDQQARKPGMEPAAGEPAKGSKGFPDLLTSHDGTGKFGIILTQAAVPRVAADAFAVGTVGLAYDNAFDAFHAVERKSIEFAGELEGRDETGHGAAGCELWVERLDFVIQRRKAEKEAAF